MQKQYLKRRRRRSTGEAKNKSQKRRPPLLSEPSDLVTVEDNSESLSSKMAATTLNPVSPNNAMLQEIKKYGRAVKGEYEREPRERT